MKWNVLFVAATLLVAASQPSVAQISVDMNQITCGSFLGYSPDNRDFVRFWMSGYYNAAANSNILNYDALSKEFRKSHSLLQDAQVTKRCRPRSRTSACGSKRRITPPTKQSKKKSAIGTKRTYCSPRGMSAFGGKADIIQGKADIKKMSANDPKRTSHIALE